VEKDLMSMSDSRARHIVLSSRS